MAAIGGTWHAKATGGYARDSMEAIDNVQQLSTVFNANGWSVMSIAAFLGNGAGESGLNPWRWENDYIPTLAEYKGWSSNESLSHGYGLVQFTPASKYVENANALKGYGPNFYDSPGKVTDGNSQALYLVNTIPDSWSGGLHDYYADDFASIGVNIDDFYSMTFDEFKAGNDTIENLVGAFELKYERPGDSAAASSYAGRVSNAKYWEGVLKTLGFITLYPYMICRRTGGNNVFIRQKRIFRR